MNAGTFYPNCFALSAIAAVLLASCEKQQEPDHLAWWEAEQERIGLDQQIALAKYRLEQSPEDLSAPLKAAHDRLAAAKEQLESLKRGLPSLRTEIADLEAQSAQYVVESRLAARAHAIGTRHDTFTDATTRTYRDALVTAIDDAGVTLRHADGIARLDYFRLTADQREWLGLDQAAATTALDREQAAALAYEQWIDQGMITIRAKQDEDRVAAAKKEQQDLTRQLMAMVAKARALPAATPAPVSRRSSWNDRWERTSYYRPRRTVYYYPVYYPSFNTRPCTVPGVRSFPARVTPARVIPAQVKPVNVNPGIPVR